VISYHVTVSVKRRRSPGYHNSSNIPRNTSRRPRWESNACSILSRWHGICLEHVPPPSQVIPLRDPAPKASKCPRREPERSWADDCACLGFLDTVPIYSLVAAVFPRPCCFFLFFQLRRLQIRHVSRSLEDKGRSSSGHRAAGSAGTIE
jgi:hypothetical protein